MLGAQTPTQVYEPLKNTAPEQGRKSSLELNLDDNYKV